MTIKREGKCKEKRQNDRVGARENKANALEC